MMRVYKHYRSMAVMFPLIIMAILGAVGLAGLFWGLSRGVSSEPPPFIFLFLIVIAAGNGWFFGGVAIEARLAEDGYVEFIGPLRKVRVAVLDILSIAPSEMSQTPAYVVRHRKGRFRMDGRLNGMHELIGELKRQNPAIELRGI